MNTETMIGLYRQLPSETQSACAFALKLFTSLNQSSASSRWTPSAPPTSRARTLTPERRSRFRAWLVSKVWEPDLRSELVDRIVFAYEQGFVDASEVKAAVRNALDRKLDHERTGGNKGKDAIWKTLASWCKSVFETHGVEWTATASVLEPRPQAPRERWTLVGNDGRPVIPPDDDDEDGAEWWEN